MFHRAGRFFRSVVLRTREDAPAVPRFSDLPRQRFLRSENMANAKDTSTIPRLVRTVPKDDSARLTACLSQKGEPGICLWFPCKNIFCFRNPGTDYTPPPPTLQAPHTHAQRVSSRRKFSPFCKCAGHGRTPLPFRSFLFLIFRSERILCSGTMVDARIYACHFAVCFVQPPVPQFCLGVRYIPLATARTAYRSGSSYFS